MKIKSSRTFASLIILISLIIFLLSYNISKNIIIPTISSKADYLSVKKEKISFVVVPINWSNTKYTQEQLTYFSNTVMNAGNVNSFINVVANLSWGEKQVIGKITTPVKIRHTITFEKKDCKYHEKILNNFAKKYKDKYLGYDQYIFAAENPCYWNGLSPSNKNFVYLNGASVTATTIAHELSHNMGLSHASSINCQQSVIKTPQACEVDEYGDYYSIMGVTHMTGVHSYNNLERYYLKQLRPDNILTITPSIQETKTITLQRSSLHNTNKINIVKILINTPHFLSGKNMQELIPKNNKLAYYLEFTQVPISTPNDTSPNVIAGFDPSPGVTIRIAPNKIIKESSSYLLTRKISADKQTCFPNPIMSLNNMFIDETNELLIKVTNVTNNSATITITKLPNDFDYYNFRIKNC